MSKKRIFLPFIFLLICSCNTKLLLSSEESSNGERNSQNAPQFPGVTTNNEEVEIFRLVNKYRQQKGLNQLAWHQEAIIQAQDHTQDMAAFRVPLGHFGSSQRYNQIQNSDPDFVKKFAENVAKNSSAAKAVNAWLLSPGHHKNIIGDYTHTGIGAVKSANGSWYYTQIFIKK